MLDKNIKFNWIKTEKFNTIALIFSFINKRTVENIAHYVMLSSILGSQTENYKTKKELNEKLYSLYNCNIYWSALNMYENENLCLYVEFINPSIVNDDTLLDEIFILIKEFIFNPLLNKKNNGFDLKNFKEKQRLVIEDIDSLYDHKGRYANFKLLSNMTRENEFPLQNVLTKEAVLKVSPESLYDFYLNIINNSFVSINGIGSYEKEQIEEKISEIDLKTNEVPMRFYSEIDFDKRDCLFLEEVQDLNQAKLRIGFRSKISAKSSLYPAYLVFSAMFGGMFNSTLSTVVRENKSLAYSIYTNAMIDKKVFTVNAGIDSDKVKEVVDIVLEELEKYRNNCIEEGEKLFNMAKECILNDMMQVYDTQGALLIRRLKDSIGNPYKYDDLIKCIYEVKMEDVIECSKLIYLDAVYVLKGER